MDGLGSEHFFVPWLNVAALLKGNSDISYFHLSIRRKRNLKAVIARNIGKAEKKLYTLGSFS